MNANFRGKVASPPMIFGTRKVESLGYRMVKKIAEKFNRLSRVHQRHRRQTDRQTDRRQTTDGSAIAYSEREREFTSANKTNSKPKLKCAKIVDTWVAFGYRVLVYPVLSLVLTFLHNMIIHIQLFLVG